jgi:hypothetical protein
LIGNAFDVWVAKGKGIVAFYEKTSEKHWKIIGQ